MRVAASISTTLETTEQLFALLELRPVFKNLDEILNSLLKDAPDQVVDFLNTYSQQLLSVAAEEQDSGFEQKQLFTQVSASAAAAIFQLPAAKKLTVASRLCIWLSLLSKFRLAAALSDNPDEFWMRVHELREAVQHIPATELNLLPTLFKKAKSTSPLLKFANPNRVSSKTVTQFLWIQLYANLVLMLREGGLPAEKSEHFEFCAAMYQKLRRSSKDLASCSFLRFSEKIHFTTASSLFQFEFQKQLGTQFFDALLTAPIAPSALQMVLSQLHAAGFLHADDFQLPVFQASVFLQICGMDSIGEVNAFLDTLASGRRFFGVTELVLDIAIDFRTLTLALLDEDGCDIAVTPLTGLQPEILQQLLQGGKASPIWFRQHFDEAFFTPDKFPRLVQSPELLSTFCGNHEVCSRFHEISNTAEDFSQFLHSLSNASFQAFCSIFCGLFPDAAVLKERAKNAKSPRDNTVLLDFYEACYLSFTQSRTLHIRVAAALSATRLSAPHFQELCLSPACQAATFATSLEDLEKLYATSEKTVRIKASARRL